MKVIKELGLDFFHWDRMGLGICGESCFCPVEQLLVGILEVPVQQPPGAEKSVCAHVEGPMWVSACPFFCIS